MKVSIESISPDGLSVKFQNDFIFDTWQEAFDFIKKVEEFS
mgnify:CR=1 FL=1